MTIFSANAIATSDQPFSNGTTEVTSAQATITGGKMYAISAQDDPKNLITKKGEFSMTNNNTIFKIELNTPLEVGDIITAKSHGGVKNEANKGLWINTEETRPTEAPACSAAAATPTDMTAKFLNYTVTVGSEYVGATALYIHRAAGATQNFDEFVITRTVKDRTPVTLTFTSATATANLGESFSAPTLTIDPDAASSEVAYTSSNTAVAMVNASTGNITLVSSGKATISATIFGSATYQDASASYTLTVVDPNALVFGLTQDDLTSSTGISTTTTYSGSYATLTNTSAAMGSSGSTRSLTNGTTSLTAAKTACQRNNLCSGASDFIEESYYAFTVNVASGYVLNINNMYGDLYYDSSRSGKYKFAVYVGSTKVWEAGSSDYVVTGGDKNSKKTLDVSGVEDLKNLTGDVEVRMVWYQNGSSSYVALKDFNIVASIDEDTRVTYDLNTEVNPAEGGYVTRDPAASSYEEGTEVTLTASANNGYYFVNWTNSEDSEVGTSTTYVHTMGAAAASFTANFAKYPVITFALGESGATGTLPKSTFTSTGSFVVPTNNSLYVAGKTLTAWNDGENDHLIGSTIEGITSDITLTPVFTDNTVSLKKTISNVTVSFPFTQNGGAPVMAAEGSSTMRVAQATIEDAFIDVLMNVDATNGKFNNNQGNTGACQVNKTVVINIPAINGMTVTINKEFETSYLGEESNKGVTSDGSTTWTYNGSAETVSLTLDESNKYPTLMTVTYPKTHTYVDVTDAGYRTFASSSALDFNEAIEGLKAYKATATGSTIKFEAINCAVPASTGMLLKADKGRYYIPLASSTPDAIENELVGVTTATEKEAGIFVLMNGAQGVGFYKTENTFTVGANTAYLRAKVAAGRTFIGLEEESETTGIEAIERSQMKDNFYNLNGQRVAAPQKGLYIVNGKKVVLK